MIANSLGDWFKRYGLWLLLGLAFVGYILARLFPDGKGDAEKKALLAVTKDKVEKLKNETAKEHATLVQEMTVRIEELKAIKAIPDEDERLKKLADFANRKRGRM